jgi:flagellar protein FlbD
MREVDMIVVTRLNESRLAVNPDLIERMHESPDTTLVLVTGTSIVVTESLDEVIDRIVAHRARVVSQAGLVDRSAVAPATTRSGGDVVQLAAHARKGGE